MRYLLSQSSRAVLTRLAERKTLCAFDFDGTLAPIVPHPDQAAMRGETRALLRALAASWPCVVVSGRARYDVLSRLEGVPVAGVIGNHGAEFAEGTSLWRQQVEVWKSILEVAVTPLPGVFLEDKGLSLAIHYRHCENKPAARRRIAAAVQGLEQACPLGGKQVVNVILCGAPTKADALAAERDRLNCDSVLFVGDDENDEPGFALKGDTVGVRVGRSSRSQAGFYLRNQAEIDACLETLLSLRQRNGEAHERRGVAVTHG